MADEKEKAAAAELEKKVGEASTSEEVRDLMIQARDEQGKFTSEKKPATAATTTTTETKDDATTTTETTVFKDTFVIGGKEVEIVGADAADVLRQYKAAMTAYEIAKTPEVKKEPEKPKTTPEELAALGLRVAQGDMKAFDEYMEKSGTLDRYLEKKGIKVEEVKKVLETQATTTIKEKWDTEVKAFLADSDWPGGTQNEYILKTKLAQLKDANGQPLAYNPSKENLQKAYEAMKAEGLVFKVDPPANTETTSTEQRTTAYERSQAQPTTEKKKATSSTLLGTSGETSTRKTDPKAGKLPEITPDMTGPEIMELFKKAAIAAGQNPDEVLRGAAKA
jgi:hypothetical protein